jgi:hypothetical protein
MRTPLLYAAFRFAIATVAIVSVSAGCNRGNSVGKIDRSKTTNHTTQTTTGQSTMGQTTTGQTTTGQTTTGQTDETGTQAVGNDVSGDGPTRENTVSLEELKADIADFEDTSKWYFGNRPDGEPVGTWLSQDEDEEPLVFEKDGSFKCGFLWSQGRGIYSTGKYAISENGLIVAVAKHKGGRLGLFYHLQDGKIIGSRGPTPLVEWKKTNTNNENEP